MTGGQVGEGPAGTRGRQVLSPEDVPPERVRRAVRAVLLAPDGGVLLMRITHPRSGRHWWLTPGGGIDDGEHHAAALRRELREEIGLDLPASRIGPPLWQRLVRFSVLYGRYTHQYETYYLVETDRFEPAHCEEGDPAHGMHPAVPAWWTADDLAVTDQRVAPTDLARLLADLTTDGPPDTPIAIAP